MLLLALDLVDARADEGWLCTTSTVQQLQRLSIAGAPGALFQFGFGSVFGVLKR